MQFIVSLNSKACMRLWTNLGSHEKLPSPDLEKNAESMAVQPQLTALPSTPSSSKHLYYSMIVTQAQGVTPLCWTLRTNSWQWHCNNHEACLNNTVTESLIHSKRQSTKIILSSLEFLVWNQRAGIGKKELHLYFISPQLKFSTSLIYECKQHTMVTSAVPVTPKRRLNIVLESLEIAPHIAYIHQDLKIKVFIRPTTNKILIFNVLVKKYILVL